MSHSSLGYSLVLVGLACAAFGAVVGLGGAPGNIARERPVRYAVYGFAAAMVLANLVMVQALLSHDFSVKYVSQVGSRSTPTIFTIVSLWSALEGSILFWGAILGVYLASFAFTYRASQRRYATLSLGVMMAVATFFAFLIAGPANPWVAVANPPLDGPGPNPLLQNHPLMIIHPPMLYLGYVGMVVPFGMAAGALLRGELGDAWLEPLRRWTMIPWGFLSVGIILGAWWAYAVLGWGGYWAWDPVENASLLPWLTATAYLHATMVLARKKSLKLWTISLCMVSFILTIVGTFMTRSGVFNSVHSFTQSTIGPTFLAFIALALVFSVVLFAVRGHLLVAESQIKALVSREGGILFNNLLLVAITFVVLLGTLYPLVTEGFLGKKITVGEPYFNQMIVPLALAMLFLMGVGPMLPWGATSLRAALMRLRLPTAVAAAVLAVSLAFGLRGALALTTFALGAFAATQLLREMADPVRERLACGEDVMTALWTVAGRARRRFGAHLIHLAIVAVIVAVAASRNYQEHVTRTLSAGDSLSIGAYQMRFDRLSSGKESAHDWVAADISLTDARGATVAHRGLGAPRMNFYPRSNDPMGTPLIESSLRHDVYVSMMAFDPKANTASFNVWIFPLVSWLWWAIPLLVAGSAISLWPRRRTGAAPVAERADAVTA